MEITIALTILNAVICVSNFVLGRKDKAVKETKQDAKEQGLISYRLEQVEIKLNKVLDILDDYDNVTKKIVEEEMEKHILKYHNKG